ncbi:MAG: hypothetical protein ACI4TC_10320 [Kiritimatiellia bacterium]
MNAKTILSLTVLGAVTAASAAVTTDNTLCRIEVASGTKSTIVAVPLVKIGTAGDAIPVTDLVLTDNMSEDDTILHWNGSTWDAWEISDGKWTPTVISEGSKYSTSAPAEGTALARGDAIWVNRSNPTVTEGEVTRAKPFYIYGQVATTDSPATLPAIVGGAYTMMGNTDLADKKISTLKFPGERQPVNGDKIVWSNSANGTGVTQYEYKDNGWGFYKSTVVEKNGRKVISSVWTSVGDADVIPAGQGFWYVAK